MIDDCKKTSHLTDESFPHDWQAEVLQAFPLIGPSRQYIYPQAVDEVERGALLSLVRPGQNDQPFLATFARGFADPSLPHGIWSCPNPNELCAVAGGYAYVVEADSPERWQQVPYRPVISIHSVPAAALLVFSGFHTLWALGKAGRTWETGRLSWEGIRIVAIEGEKLHGFGWDLHTDSEVPFIVDLATGTHIGGVDFGQRQH